MTCKCEWFFYSFVHSFISTRPLEGKEEGTRTLPSEGILAAYGGKIIITRTKGMMTFVQMATGKPFFCQLLIFFKSCSLNRPLSSADGTLSRWLGPQQRSANDSPWPNSSPACFGTACQLRMIFTFLNGWRGVGVWGGIKRTWNSNFSVHSFIGTQPCSFI